MLQPLERPRVYRTFFRWLLEHTARHHVDEGATIDLLQLLEGLLNLMHEVTETDTRTVIVECTTVYLCYS